MDSYEPHDTTVDDDSWADDFDGDISIDDAVGEDDYVSPLSSGVVENLTGDEESADDFSDFEDGDASDDFSDFEGAETSGEDEVASESTALEGILVPDEKEAGDNLDFTRPLSREEAEELTEHIRSTADVLYVLIARAHAGKAYLALGYPSFEKYVKAEFDISRSRAYQFLNQAHVIEAITAAAPDGTHVKISEAAARDLKNFVDELAPEIKERTEGVAPEDAGAIIEDLVNDYRERAKKPQEDEANDFNVDDLSLDDIDFDIPDFDSSGGEGGSKGGSDFDNLDGFDNLDDLPGDVATGGFDEDPLEFRAKVENTYSFYTAIAALDKMPSVDEVVQAIPDARRSHIDATLPKVLAWLQEFSDKWNGVPGDESSADAPKNENEEAENNEEGNDDFADFNDDFADIDTEE